MSGGHFDYNQYRISDIAEQITDLIENNEREYTDETLARFTEAVSLLERAAVYAQRIDWLVSSDDSEDCFHRRLAEDLQELNEGADDA